MGFVDEFRKKRVLKFLSEISKETDNIASLGKDKLDYIFKTSLDLLDLPLPNSEIYDYFLVPEIMGTLLLKLIYLMPKEENTRLDNIHIISEVLNEEKGKSVKYRVLGEKGVYPNCEIERENCKYTIINSLPVLITEENSKNFTVSSELSVPMNKNELRFATCAILAPSNGVGCFMFTYGFSDYNTLTIKKNVLNMVPGNLQIYFLHQLLQYQNLMQFREDIYRLDNFFLTVEQPDIVPDTTEYTFSSFNKYIDIFYKLFDNFNIRSNLLLKTSYYFIKALMLIYSNLAFAEEATADVFFCLEGCMHLMQKKYGIKGARLNLSKLQAIFKENLPRGEELFEYMQEVYERRNELVHAKLDWGVEWPVSLYADDLFENIDLCKELLNFVLIGRWIEDEKEKEVREFTREVADLNENQNGKGINKG
ncbi:MAG: hypothetical protein ACP5QX_05120 [Caldisericaceae bacterium]